MDEITKLSDRYNNSILLKDEDNFDKIKEIFGYDENTNLIPQCFWGNIPEPKVVILAENPSFVVDDILDNKYFRKTLLENLKLNRSKDINNILFSNKSYDNNVPFELSYVSKYWKRFFDKNIKESNKDIFMNDVCIINLCGYYKTNLKKDIPEELYWFYDNKNNDYSEEFKNIFDHDNLIIITVWVKNNNPWIKVLSKLNVNTDKVLEAEKNGPYNPYVPQDYLKDFKTNEE